MTDSSEAAFLRNAPKMFKGMSYPKNAVLRDSEQTQPVRIDLPFPTSIHKAFRKHNGSYLSEEYKKWRDIAGWKLLGQRPGKLAGPVKVLIELHAPDGRARDADNFIKAPVDLLVEHGVIEGDSDRCVREITVRWVGRGSPCTIYVEQVK